LNKILLHTGFLLLFVGLVLLAVSDIREQLPRERQVIFIGKASDLGAGETLTADLEEGSCRLGLLEYESIEPDSVFTIVREDNVEVYRAPMVESWNRFTARYDYGFWLEQSGRYFIDLKGVRGFTIEISASGHWITHHPRFSYPYHYLFFIGAVFAFAGLTVVSKCFFSKYERIDRSASR
jgi:hypothetical protein